MTLTQLDSVLIMDLSPIMGPLGVAVSIKRGAPVRLTPVREIEGAPWGTGSPPRPSQLTTPSFETQTSYMARSATSVCVTIVVENTDFKEPFIAEFLLC